MKILFVLFCIAYIAGLGFWLMHCIDSFCESGGFRPTDQGNTPNGRLLPFPSGNRDEDSAA